MIMRVVFIPTMRWMSFQERRNETKPTPPPRTKKNLPQTPPENAYSMMMMMMMISPNMIWYPDM